MLIPQGMAYAILAGLPPVYGLYASIIPLIIYAFLGTSRHLAVGPVAVISIMVFAGVSEFAEPGTDRFIQLAIATALGVGITQVLMGLTRMGFLVNFLSHPVLSGFTFAAVLIIASSQFKGLFGLVHPGTSSVFEIIWYTFTRITDIHIITSIIGITSIIALMSLKRLKPRFPAAIFVVSAGILGVWGLNLHEAGVSIVGNIPGGLPSISVPLIGLSDFGTLIPMILVISLVSFMESIAVAKAIATKNGYKVDANKELIALGSANLGGSLFQSFPTTGGISRSAVNFQSGARTGLASLFSAGVVAITVLFLTPLFYFLPTAVLAAVIIVAVFSLVDFHAVKTLWHTDKRDFAMFGITFLATLGIGIEEGIVIGVLMSLLAIIYKSTKPHSAELGRLGDSDNYRNITRYEDAIIRPDVLIFRFDSPLYFTSSQQFTEKLENRVKSRDKKLQHVVLDASAINYTDSTGIHTLEDILGFLRKRGAILHIAGAIGPVRDKLKLSGLMQKIGRNNFHFDVAEAVKSIDAGNHAFTENESETDAKTSPRHSPIQTNR